MPKISVGANGTKWILIGGEWKQATGTEYAGTWPPVNQMYDTDTKEAFQLDAATNAWRLLGAIEMFTPAKAQTGVAPQGYQSDEAQRTYWDPKAWDAENQVMGKWVPFGTSPVTATQTTTPVTATQTTMPVTPGLEEFRLTPDQLQARYEQAYNIPTAGQTPYHKWLAQQWALPSMSYGLAAQGLGGATPYTGTFENFLGSYGSPARVPAQYANQFMALSPQAQAQMAELTGFNQRDVEAMAATGRLQQTYAPWAASARVGQMMSPTAERRFGLTTGAATGEDTFLNYLRTKYGF